MKAAAPSHDRDGPVKGVNDVTDRAHEPGTEVLVELSGCAEGDAHTVFEALRASFPCDRAAHEVPHEASRTRPTIWAATIDVHGTQGAVTPGRLGAPVTVDVQGGYHAVDRLRETLTSAFAVRVVGTASGDQENEVQLRLENR